MDGLTLATATVAACTSYPYTDKLILRPSSPRVKTRSSFKRKELRLLSRRTKFFALAAKEDGPNISKEKDESKLHQWDQMGLEFGRMLGEDPKLTLAKIMARKVNPGVSYVEVEKSFHKNKGKLADMKELFDVPDDFENLARPIPKEDFKFEVENNPSAKEDESKLDQWEQMELEFGRMLGEDPKLTLAKIMGRKAAVSFVQVEKSFHKNKGKLTDMKELLFDVPDDKEKSQSKPLDGLGLVRPIPKEGFKFQVENKPVASSKVHKQEQPVQKAVELSVPNVILRKKPGLFVEDDENKPEKSRVKIRPNLTLKMGNGAPKEKFNMTLLKKPQPLSTGGKPEDSVNLDVIKGDDSVEMIRGRREVKSDYNMTLLKKPQPLSTGRKPEDSVNLDVMKGDDSVEMIRGRREVNSDYNGSTLLKKPEIAKSDIRESSEIGDESNQKEQISEDDSFTAGMQPLEKTNIGLTANDRTINRNSHIDSAAKYSVEAALQRKQKSQVQSVEESSTSGNQEQIPVVPGSQFWGDTANTESHGHEEELDNLSSISPIEEDDWRMVEELLKTGERMYVEIISFSTGGFGVSFGTLIGFLPYRDLVAKWKFFAFESWLRKNGLDPSIYKKDLGVIESNDFWKKNSYPSSSTDSKVDHKPVGDITPDMKLEDLIWMYDQEKLKFLSTFVGQKTKVNVLIADRGLRKLVVSMRQKEKEGSVETKRKLMVKLQVGDIVKCRIQKITYFGIFVEFEGVTALIHHTEISWDAATDPTSYFKVGQIVEAKVNQLDFTLYRIYLSLKDIAPDPMIEALESVLGKSEAETKADVEWPEVESLIHELQQIDRIQSVTKGRFFFSPGLAPTFQVYFASMFENHYKLLARSENKAQEVMVRTSLDNEEMKSIILSCTNRVK